MGQSNVIFGFILIAYIIYITLKGKLPIYLTLLRGGGQQPAGAGSRLAGSVLQGAANVASGLNDFFSGGGDDGGSDSGYKPSGNLLDDLGLSDSSYKGLASGQVAP